MIVTTYTNVDKSQVVPVPVDGTKLAVDDATFKAMSPRQQLTVVTTQLGYQPKRLEIDW